MVNFYMNSDVVPFLNAAYRLHINPLTMLRDSAKQSEIQAARLGAIPEWVSLPCDDSLYYHPEAQFSDKPLVTISGGYEQEWLEILVPFQMLVKTDIRFLDSYIESKTEFDQKAYVEVEFIPTIDEFSEGRNAQKITMYNIYEQSWTAFFNKLQKENGSKIKAITLIESDDHFATSQASLLYYCGASQIS